MVLQLQRYIGAQLKYHGYVHSGPKNFTLFHLTVVSANVDQLL